ncbi:MAG: hypothetical protein ACKVPJ_13725 [Chitinophagales bacterium]
MKHFTLSLLIISGLFYQCKNNGSAENKEGSAETQTTSELGIHGFWVGNHPTNNGELIGLECLASTKNAIFYNYFTQGKVCRWALNNNSSIEILSEENNLLMSATNLLGDSIMQMNTLQNMMVGFKKTLIAKKESFEFSGILNGLDYEDQHIVLENPAYLFVHSGINDSIIQFNVFSQGGKKLTSTGAANFGAKLQKGDYFIRAFQRRDLKEARDKAAFRIEFVLLHTTK